MVRKCFIMFLMVYLIFFYLPLINAYELIDLGTMCSYELRSAFLAIFYIRIDCKDYFFYQP